MKNHAERRSPVHPGDFLQEDFMKPLELTPLAVANAVGASLTVINQIIRHQRGVSPEMALKLGRLFCVPPDLWMGIQADYDLEMARHGEQAPFST
jgi:addiction module HigA family antidote